MWVFDLIDKVRLGFCLLHYGDTDNCIINCDAQTVILSLCVSVLIELLARNCIYGSRVTSPPTATASSTVA